MSAQEVLARLAHIARFDVRKLFDPETGEAKPIKDLDEATAAALVSFETELLLGKDGGNLGIATRKVKAADKIAALKVLAEHHGIVGSDAQQAAGALVDALAERMEAARQRAIEQAEADRLRTIEAQDMRITHTAAVDITSNSANSPSSTIPSGYEDAEKSRPETGPQ